MREKRLQGNREALWTFRIFFIFSALWRGKGSPRRLEGGGNRIFIENPTRGGGVSRRGRGREGVCGELGNFGDSEGGGG